MLRMSCPPAVDVSMLSCERDEFDPGRRQALEQLVQVPVRAAEAVQLRDHERSMESSDASSRSSSGRAARRPLTPRST